MYFEIQDNQKKLIGTGFVFPDGVVTVHGEGTGSTFYSNLNRMKSIHRDWVVVKEVRVTP